MRGEFADGKIMTKYSPVPISGMAVDGDASVFLKKRCHEVNLLAHERIEWWEAAKDWCYGYHYYYF